MWRRLLGGPATASAVLLPSPCPDGLRAGEDEGGLPRGVEVGQLCHVRLPDAQRAISAQPSTRRESMALLLFRFPLFLFRFHFGFISVGQGVNRQELWLQPMVRGDVAGRERGKERENRADADAVVDVDADADEKMSQR